MRIFFQLLLSYEINSLVLEVRITEGGHINWHTSQSGSWDLQSLDFVVHVFSLRIKHGEWAVQEAGGRSAESLQGYRQMWGNSRALLCVKARSVLEIPDF